MCLKNGGKNSVGTFSKKELFIMKQRKIMLKTIEDAKKFVNASIKCDFDIDVFYNRVVIDAKSILGVMTPLYKGSSSVILPQPAVAE